MSTEGLHGSCRPQADSPGVLGAAFDESQTAGGEEGSWEDIRWGQPPAPNFPRQETKVRGRRGFGCPVTPGPVSPGSPAPPAPPCTGPALPGPACLCGSPSGRRLVLQSGLRSLARRGSHHPQPAGDTGSAAVRSGPALQGDESPKGTYPTAPQGSAGTIKCWVKTVNAGAIGRTRPSCPTCSGLLPRPMTRTRQE